MCYEPYNTGKACEPLTNGSIEARLDYYLKFEEKVEQELINIWRNRDISVNLPK